ncbi:MAG: hypothetical protein NXI04_08645 [Planctomycetaceae bacterium]|nr:hypothetical protein [Planctomycetaceae bacterium]
MESSRGGPLTTFIMMLPLIVVPTIAMLRPAGSDGSLLSNLLSAAPEADTAAATPDDVADAVFSELSDDSFGEAPDFSTPDDEFADLENQLFAEASGMSATPAAPDFDTTPSAGTGTPGASGAAGSPAVTSQLLGRMKQMGAHRTMWFEPGDGRFGFVAFFRAGNGIVSYRFESVAATESAAIIDVMQQAQAWQTNTRQ